MLASRPARESRDPSQTLHRTERTNLRMLGFRFLFSVSSITGTRPR